MPSPKSKTKPVLSMTRPKIDAAAADAFVRGAGGTAAERPAPKAEPAPDDPTPAPKLVEVVSMSEVEAQPVSSAQVAVSVDETSPSVQVDEPKAPRRSKAKAKKRAPEAKPVGRGIVTRSTGRQVRRRVVYLPPSLDKKLAVAAAMRGEDVSDVVASLLLAHL